MARAVAGVIDGVDTTAIEAGYSSLGRHGVPPKWLLRCWVYASLVGLHHSTKLARAMETDAALQWLCGGHAVSASTLRKFRQRHGALFTTAIDYTVRIAVERGLLDPTALAVDSMRLRAHAATRAVRTVTRSTKRLATLATVDAAALNATDRATHTARVEKHEEALRLCAERDRPNVVLTNPSAALMKFPNGAAMPGHRVTVAAAGVQTRLVVAVLVDDGGNDFGRLRAPVEQARAALDRAGLPTTKLGVVADAGYTADTDYAFAAEAAPWADVLIASTSATGDRGGDGKAPALFSHADFLLGPDDSLRCPANRQMLGPYNNGDGRLRWVGHACGTCELRPRCTTGKQRSVTLHLVRARTETAMRARLATPEGQAHYGRRMAIVEPVFANLEDVIGFRRASTRHTAAVLAEILLKVLAHNVSRILSAARLSCVRCAVTMTGTLDPLAQPENASETEF